MHSIRPRTTTMSVGTVHVSVVVGIGPFYRLPLYPTVNRRYATVGHGQT